MAPWRAASCRGQRGWLRALGGRCAGHQKSLLRVCAPLRLPGRPPVATCVPYTDVVFLHPPLRHITVPWGAGGLLSSASPPLRMSGFPRTACVPRQDLGFPCPGCPG